jgi:hypothetical protein
LRIQIEIGGKVRLATLGHHRSNSPAGRRALRFEGLRVLSLGHLEREVPRLLMIKRREPVATLMAFIIISI